MWPDDDEYPGEGTDYVGEPQNIEQGILKNEHHSSFIIPCSTFDMLSRHSRNQT